MNFQSMKFRLIMFGVALIVASIVLRLVFVIPYAKEVLRDVVMAQQLSIASYVARDVDHSIVVRQALIGELASSLPPGLLNKPDELSAWLKERQQLNPLFNSGLLVIRADGGRILADYPVVAGRDQLTFTDRTWFREALASNAPVMSVPQRGRLGDPIIVMAAAIRDSNQRVVAVVAGIGVLNATGFLDGLQQNRLGATGGFLLISPADKLFVGSSDSSMILKPTPPTGVNLLHDRAMAGYRGTGITINAKGVEEVSAIASVPSTGWFVVARVPTAEAFRVIEVLRSFVMQYSLLIMAAMVGILLIALPRMLRPLTDTAHAMREMADGKRELAPLPVQGKDEIGDLILGFNYLVKRLREKEVALKASEARMEFLAHHDSLTNLYNRAMLIDRLEQVLANAKRNGSRFALLFYDVDCFKPINDEFGHAVGDAVLIELAERLLQGRRQVDTVARLGGDEFVILLTDLSDPHAEAEKIAQQSLKAIAAPYEMDGRRFELSTSIGVTLYQGGSASSSQLLSQADIAMYQAKRAGKNRICFFEESMTKKPASEAGADDPGI